MSSRCGARLRHDQLRRHDASVERRQRLQHGRVGMLEAKDHGVDHPVYRRRRSMPEGTGTRRRLPCRPRARATTSRPPTVSGEPSANFRFGRSLKVIVLPSWLTSQDDARPGTTLFPSSVGLGQRVVEIERDPDVGILRGMHRVQIDAVGLPTIDQRAAARRGPRRARPSSKAAVTVRKVRRRMGCLLCSQGNINSSGSAERSTMRDAVRPLPGTARCRMLRRRWMATAASAGRIRNASRSRRTSAADSGSGQHVAFGQVSDDARSRLRRRRVPRRPRRTRAPTWSGWCTAKAPIQRYRCRAVRPTRMRV